MGNKDYKSLQRHLVEGLARLLDLGSTRSISSVPFVHLEEEIYQSIKENWEEVGENIREALNQYEPERQFQERQANREEF